MTFYELIAVAVVCAAVVLVAGLRVINNYLMRD